MNKLLSVVVPTKNRYKYLKYLIQLVDSFHSDEIELVVQDNSDDNQEILDFLEIDKQKYPSVAYFYSDEYLSMSGNSDKAVLNSQGEYVCFIGDDDGICRDIIDCVHWMKANNIDALRSQKTGFVWGDSTSNKLNNSSACLIYDMPSCSYKELSAIDELKKILKRGFQTIDNIPVLYNGIVKRTILNNIYTIGNTFFPGGSPDISNGVALSFYVERFVLVNFPVVISGSSKMTGGGIYKIKGRSLPIEEVPFIDRRVVDNWESDIPRVWAGRLAWPESGIKGLKYVSQSRYIKCLNRNYMYAAFSIYYVQHFKLACKFAPNKFLFYYYLIVILISNALRVIINKLISVFCSSRYVGRYIIRDVPDIIVAEQTIYEINKNNRIDFQKIKKIK